MKGEGNRIFKTSGIIGLFGLICVTGLMVFWPWSLDSQSQEVSRAKQKAEVVAYQIIQIYREAKSEAPAPIIKNQGRGLASTPSNVPAGGILTEFKNQGNMGSDPWGRPFQYRIVDLESGPRLMVWSNGPNGVLDGTSILSENPVEAIQPPKVGDDIIVLMSIPESDPK